MGLDHLPDFGLWGLIVCLREDHKRTGDAWYAEEADRVYAELSCRLASK